LEKFYSKNYISQTIYLRLKKSHMIKLTQYGEQSHENFWKFLMS